MAVGTSHVERGAGDGVGTVMGKGETRRFTSRFACLKGMLLFLVSDFANLPIGFFNRWRCSQKS